MDRKILTIFTAGLLIASLTLAFGSTVGAGETTLQEDQQPVWEEGDTWAMGYEQDLDELFQPIIEEFEQMMEEDEEFEEISEIEDITLDLDGDFGFYQIYEVTEANDGYTMEMNAGGGLSVEGEIEITAELPEDGTEVDPETEPDDLPMETRTMTFGGAFAYSLDMNGEIHYTEEMNIDKMDLEIDLEMEVSAEFENMPISEDLLVDIWREQEPETFTIDYTDYEITLDVDISTDLEIDFDPALNFFDHQAIMEEESWIAESEMDRSGNYEGTVDVTGVPDEIKEDIETMVGQEFPINLEDIPTGDPYIGNGEIDPPSETIEVPLECTGTSTTVIDGEEVEVYEIEFTLQHYYPALTQQEPGFQLLYSADDGFIVEQEMYLGEEMEEFGMADMSMRSMDPTEAEESMQEKQQIDDEDDDFAFMLPLIVIVVIAAVIAVAVLMRKKGGKSPSKYEFNEKEPVYPQQEPTKTGTPKDKGKQHFGYEEEQKNSPSKEED